MRGRDLRGDVRVADAMKAVAANAEARADLFRQARIRARARGSVAWNAVSNTATCGTRANSSRAPAHRRDGGRIVQRREPVERAERRQHVGRR